jgi:predicted transcriptional regulator
MTSKTISPKVMDLVRAEMSRRKYSSPDEVMIKALEALAEQQQAIDGIKRGLSDFKAGRAQTRHQFDKEFRRNNKLPPRA